MRAGAVVGLVACLALSGCATSSPKPAPRAAPTPSPSPSSAPRAPVLPSGASPVHNPPASVQPGTPIGAATFVKYWFAELDSAYRLGRTADNSKALSDASCQSCRNFTGIADTLFQRGHHLRGPAFLAVQAEAPPVQGGFEYVSFVATLPARDEVDSHNRLVRHVGAEGALRLTVIVARRDQGWIVRAMEPVK